MPNWVQNEIVFTHESKEKVDGLAEAVQKEGILNYLRPMPHFEDGDSGWYPWCVENWGTKWDLCHIDWSDRQDDNTLIIRAESAWSPPVEAFKFAEEQGWKINAVFFDAGACFAGTHIDGVTEMKEVDNCLYRVITAGFSSSF